MSEDYTPSMADLREAYVLNRMRNIDKLLAPGTSSKDLEDKGRADANRAIAAHDAKLRVQIALEILDRRPPATTEPSLREYITGLRSGHVMAASIARGKEQA